MLVLQLQKWMWVSERNPLRRYGIAAKSTNGNEKRAFEEKKGAFDNLTTQVTETFASLVIGYGVVNCDP